ncbi:MAG: 2-phospho-L-lactate transferase [Anaerolineae bacterium]
MKAKQVVALAGGVGGAKLVYGLARALTAGQLTVVGNVADDFTLYGLHISPDLDTVMYTLAGIANPETGWGVAGDSWQMLAMLMRYGEEGWFRLGDRDLATHLLRTHWLAQGMSLTEVTARLAQALGVQQRLLPVTDDPLATLVETAEYGTLAFQEYFVRHRWQPVARRVWFEGAETAQMTAAVAQALAEADLVVICPSNPVLSIAPILAVGGVREALQGRAGRCVAVSPFIGGQAVKGPAAKLMPELGLDISVKGLWRFYEGLIDGLVVDVADAAQLEGEKKSIFLTYTLMKTDEDKVRLAQEILDWVEKL